MKPIDSIAGIEPSGNGSITEKPAISKRGNNRLKAVALASRGKLVNADKFNIDDDTLLADVTLAARDAALSESSLTQAVTACCTADIDRDDVINAIIDGGWSESRARNVVSAVYRDAGKGMRNTKPDNKPGKKIAKVAIDLADTVITGGRINGMERAQAIKTLRAALRYLVAQEKEAKAKAKRETAQAKPEAEPVKPEATTEAKPARRKRKFNSDASKALAEIANK